MIAMVNHQAGHTAVDADVLPRDNEGLMSFEFKDYSTIVHEPEPGELFYESFDDCNGIGGNDSIFSGGSTGIGTFMRDNDDWVGLAMTGANRCVKSGTNTKSGQMTTPEFHIDSIATFTFLAAPFGNDGVALTLSVNGTASVSHNTFTVLLQNHSHQKFFHGPRNNMRSGAFSLKKSEANYDAPSIIPCRIQGAFTFMPCLRSNMPYFSSPLPKALLSQTKVEKPRLRASLTRNLQ